jgi:GNAT superfamily N-acetyltransferase
MTIRINKEFIAGKFEALDPLLHAHWEELATDKDLMVLKPDKLKYLQLEVAGVLHSLFMYDDDKLIGYSANFIGPNLHYSDLIVLTNDVLFVDPAYRNGLSGIRLIEATENMGEALGAKLTTFHAKTGTVLAQLMLRRGYRVQDILLSRKV